jgi:ribonuclease HI
MPIGFKNATDGDIQMAINAVLSAASPHSFVGIDRQGSTIVMRTTGNPDGHLILRGGRSGANFDRLHVYEAYRRMCSSGLHPAVVIDCSHGNSEKKPERQALVLRDVLAQRLDPDSPLIGFMAESNLEQGNQDISPSGEGLRYGVSVTDPCIGWAETVSLLEEAWTRTELPPGSAGSSSHQQKVLSAGSSEVMIFTDGGCSGNPGPGGWAYVIVAPGTSTDRSVGSSVIAERWGAEESTTNNRMELSAAVAALNASLNDPRLAVKSITVYTDSQYVQKGISTWIISWKKNGWQTSSKEPVKNKDLWQELDKLTTRLSIQWRWVKGHAGNEFNERCDALTQEAIASLRV